MIIGQTLSKSFCRDSYLPGKKKEPKPKLFGLDMFGWGGRLPREGVDIPGAPEKFEKKKVCVQFSSPILTPEKLSEICCGSSQEEAETENARVERRCFL